MGFLSSIFGSTPKVPNYNSVSIGDSQQQALTQNQQILPSSEALATGVTNFNEAQLSSLLNSIMPGWSANAATTSSNIGSELSGKIPTDVAGNIQSSAAAQALTGGFGGSGLAGNLTAKDLGLTSLDLMQQGQSAEQSWTSLIDQMFAPGMGSITSMFVSPQQQFQDNTQNAENQFSADWLKNQVAAQPNPVFAGLTGASLLLGKSALNFGGFSSGGGGGGGGGFTMGGSFMSDFNNPSTNGFQDYSGGGGGGGVVNGIQASSSGGQGSALDSGSGSIVGTILGLL